MTSPPGRVSRGTAGGWHDATWWSPALSTLIQMVADAGFDDVQVTTIYNLGDRDNIMGGGVRC
jgi:hypothetical protein